MIPAKHNFLNSRKAIDPCVTFKLQSHNSKSAHHFEFLNQGGSFSFTCDHKRRGGIIQRTNSFNILRFHLSQSLSIKDSHRLV